jgi:hypothetical protein
MTCTICQCRPACALSACTPCLDHLAVAPVSPPRGLRPTPPSDVASFREVVAGYGRAKLDHRRGSKWEVGR